MEDCFFRIFDKGWVHNKLYISTLDMIDLSIVIVSYNTKKITQDCLESINRSLTGAKIKYEIIVVDNDSHDGFQELLETMSQDNHNNLIYKQTGQNLGFGKGTNLGVKSLKGQYVLLLNSDTIILKPGD